MKEIYIHVGYPKCASTFLQWNVFPHMDLHLIANRMDKKYMPTARHTISLSELHEGKNLISCEQMVGSILKYDHYTNGNEIADRIKHIYPDAKIILVERNQNDWLKSIYQQFMVDSYKMRFAKNYKDWYDNHLNHNILNFKGYRKKLQETFDDVLVLDFENLKKDNDEFIQEICNFINIPFPDYDKKIEKSRLSERHYSLIKIFSRLGFHEFNKRYILGLLRRIN